MNANRRNQRITRMIIAGALLTLLFGAAAIAQDQPDVVWQAGNNSPALAFSTDGQRLLAGTNLRQVADGSLVRAFHLPYNGSGVNAVALSPDGQYAAIAIQAYNQNLDLFRVADGALVAGRITAHTNGTAALAFSADGQMLASGGMDGTANLWHVPDMTLIRTINGAVGYRPRVLALAFVDNGQTLAIGGQGGVSLFRVADGEPVRTLTTVSTRSLAVSPDQQMLASGSIAIDQQGQCSDCRIRFWRISDGAWLRTIEGNNDGIITLAFSPDQEYIAAGSGDRVYSGVVRVFRLSDGALLAAFNQDPNNVSSYVSSVAYSPDGGLLAFARQDGLVVVARNHEGQECATALSLNDQMFAASGGGGHINLATGSNCAWTAASNDSWIVLTSPASGTGAAAVLFEVRENFSGGARTGSLSVAGQRVTVMQSGQAGDCGYGVTPSFGTVAGGGGGGTITVTAAAGCAWEADSKAGWITVTPGGGIGGGVVSYTVAANPNAVARKGKITIAGQTIAIKQKAN